MRRAAPAAVLVALGALAATPAAAAGAPGPRVETMVVARDGRVVFAARPVLAAQTTVAAGRRRCRVAAGTPLAALAAARRAGGPPFGVADLASACSARSARDSAGLFVRRIGRDRNRGQAGWVYKAGTRAGTSGAADPSGPFGAGRLRSGARVLWFWCRAALDCQRSLVVLPAARSLAPGAPLRVTVRAFDDLGRGRAVAGATVTFGRMRAVTGAGGRAVLAGPAPAGAPVAPGRYRLAASARGAIPAFPETVRIG